MTGLAPFACRPWDTRFDDRALPDVTVPTPVPIVPEIVDKPPRTFEKVFCVTGVVRPRAPPFVASAAAMVLKVIVGQIARPTAAPCGASIVVVEASLLALTAWPHASHAAWHCAPSAASVV